MNGRPPQLSPLRLLVGLVLPWIAYVIIRAISGSSVGALAITDAVPSISLTRAITGGACRRQLLQSREAIHRLKTDACSPN